MDQRTCAVCKGALPDGSSARRLYCSEKCRAWASRHLNARSCGVEGCARPHLARGLCGAHYNEAHMADRHKRKVETACAVCGKPIVKTGSTSKSRRPVCSYRCRSILRGHKPRSREVVGPVPRTERAPRPATPPVNVIWSTGGIFMSGPCSWCGEQFTAWTTTTARYCSRTCSRGAAKAARGGQFAISPIARAAIYERDGWTCQLCMEPVDRNLPRSDDWAPSLDHIIPQSRQAVPDHSPSNLRLAHRWCNAVRGDERYYTAADLVA